MGNKMFAQSSINQVKLIKENEKLKKMLGASDDNDAMSQISLSMASPQKIDVHSTFGIGDQNNNVLTNNFMPSQTGAVSNPNLLN